METWTNDNNSENLFPRQGVPHLFECEVELVDAVYVTIYLESILLCI